MKTRPAWHLDFDNAIAAVAPQRRAYPLRPWICLGLLVACLIPRAIMAWRTDVICEDGPFYIMAAQYLQRGELSEAFAAGNFRLNVYPILLAWFHAFDWDWVSVGKWVSVAAAVLAVLPMFGWVRRQFNDPIATLTCLIYASHPALIERSPEVLRCPTYWLLLMLTLYLLWRAVIEVRIVLFVLAGLAVALAVHTRVEGWFVLVPWALWSAMRFVSLGCQRWRLALGSALFAAMIPAFIVAVNLTWLKNHPQWEFCFSYRLAVIQAAWERIAPAENQAEQPTSAFAPATQQSVATGAPTPIAPPSLPAPTAAPTSDSAPLTIPAIAVAPLMPQLDPALRADRMAWNYARKLVDSFGIACGLLSLVGLACYGNVLLRRDQLAVFCMSLTTFAAIAAQQWRMGEVIGRYFFPILLVTLPYIALGLYEVAQRLARTLQRAAASLGANPHKVMAVLLLVVAAIGCTDALTNSFEPRRQRRDLGNWLRTQIGPNQRIMGTGSRELTLMYYSQGRYSPLRAEDVDASWFRHAMSVDPVGVVVLFKQKAEQSIRLAERLQTAGAQFPYRYQAVAADGLPASCRNITVLVPAPTAERLALKPAESR